MKIFLGVMLVMLFLLIILDWFFSKRKLIAIAMLILAFTMILFFGFFYTEGLTIHILATGYAISRSLTILLGGKKEK